MTTTRATRTRRGLPGLVVVELVVVAVAVVAALMALGYGLYTDEGDVGPGWLPFAAAVVMGLAALGDAVRQLRGRTSTDEPTVAEVREAAERAGVDVLGRDAATRTRQLVAVVGLVVAAVVLTPVIGFLAAFGLLVLVCGAVVERRPVVPSAVAALAVTAAVWAVFQLGLGIPLPAGVLVGR